VELFGGCGGENGERERFDPLIGCGNVRGRCEDVVLLRPRPCPGARDLHQAASSDLDDRMEDVRLGRAHIGFGQACPWTETCLMFVSLRARKIRISHIDGTQSHTQLIYPQSSFPSRINYRAIPNS
jgi:hypothetical protein